MSYEEGPNLGFVFKVEDPTDLIGYTANELEWTQAMMGMTVDAGSGMDRALERVMQSPPGPEIIEEMTANNEWLIAANLSGASREPGSSFAPVGLMYASGEKDKPDAPEFSVVRMGVWIAPVGAKVSSRQSLTHRDRDQIRRGFYNWPSESDNDDPEDILVTSSTAIVPQMRSGTDGIRVPFRHVHREDYLAIAGIRAQPSIIKQMSLLLLGEHGGIESFQDIM